jgi:hypothetical protein
LVGASTMRLQVALEGQNQVLGPDHPFSPLTTTVTRLSISIQKRPIEDRSYFRILCVKFDPDQSPEGYYWVRRIWLG